MNFEFDAVMFLALFTLGAGLVVGVISLMRTKKAQDQHEDAAVAQRQRAEDARDDAGADQAEDFTGPNDGGRSWSPERGANPPTPSIQTPPD